MREMHIKTTMTYHLTSIRWSIIKKKIDKNADEDVEKREHLYTVGGIVNWYSHYEKQYGRASRN